MKMKSNAPASHNFSTAPTVSKPRSQFRRDFTLKTTIDVDNLYPFFVDEALPGDTFAVKFNGFARITTPLKPVMDNLWMETSFWAVPMRIVWDNFQKFMGEQINPGDSTDFLIPQMVSPLGTGHLGGSLADYFGIPTLVPGLSHSALWFRAYYLIWNEWFRDQNLQDSLVVPKGDGPDLPGDYILQKRNKKHDYFTSCLPFPQKGPDVAIPLGTSAPLTISGNGEPTFSVNAVGSQNLEINSTLSDVRVSAGGASVGQNLSWTDPALTGIADLTAATAATINAWREAVTTQQFFELDARSGTRYTEIVLGHFGVRSDDARLNRPEYLSGGSSPVNFTAVAQTTNDGIATPLGNLAAYGTASTQGHGFTKSFTEHHLVLGLINVRADITYQSGLDRMWSRESRLDFYDPIFANLGEQAVLNKEIFAQGSAAPVADEEAFGYQERWSEYRYKTSMITGKFRSNAAGSLDLWHLSQDFGSLPLLNSSFIESKTPIDRVVAVPTEPDFILDTFIQFTAARPMPVNSIPGIPRF